MKTVKPSIVINQSTAEALSFDVEAPNEDATVGDAMRIALGVEDVPEEAKAAIRRTLGTHD